ncbi:type I-E CRISPR-associated protein Cse1/CasA [Arhodomonas aquaeolei]|uniref:type I-E CRISPR-associated protein Cse1/CasA n=1 Tax=Arhodomonas aquaeolei TaxID=2369 RepID=UPI00036AFBB6|nr:type I-E CRISPR-associated protein Cse1/CasA [Arhodomonas aquaeolei]
MNLIDDPWLPFRRRDGSIVYGPPEVIGDPDVIDVAPARADFRGAAWQFLIGLVQTASAPANHGEWGRLWREPPSPEALRQRFETYRAAFGLLGDGARFMQDFQLPDKAKITTVASLLIESPGEQGLKQNTDHFVKRGVGEVLCPACAALALFTLQINGPAGGTGYRVGVRGGGPLTTLILPREDDASLWRKLLLNILPRDTLGYDDFEPDDWRVFPWLASTRTSEPKSPTLVTTPDDVHPLHVFWAMPNRIRLETAGEHTDCRICGRDTERGIRQIRMTNYGYNYAGSWIHPLTPYREDPRKSDPPISQKGQQGGLGYRHWESLTLEDTEQAGNLPARVVMDYQRGKYRALRRLGGASRRARLWVFGYDMKQNKPRGWYSTEMPLIAADTADRDRLLEWVRQLDAAADGAAWRTRSAVKAAWFARPGDARGDFSFVEQRFREATSAAFYACLGKLGDALDSAGTVMPAAIAGRWHRAVRTAALGVFDDLALAGDTEAQDLKRVVAARNRLNSWLGNGREMKHLREAAAAQEEPA